MAWPMEILRICPETASDKALCDEAFIIAKNPNYGQYQCGLASMAMQDKTANKVKINDKNLAIKLCQSSKFWM